MLERAAKEVLLSALMKSFCRRFSCAEVKPLIRAWDSPTNSDVERDCRFALLMAPNCVAVMEPSRPEVRLANWAEDSTATCVVVKARSWVSVSCASLALLKAPSRAVLRAATS